MASFTILNEDSIDPRTLNSGEFGFIGAGASLSTLADAITASGSVLISVQGTVIGGSSAITHSSGVFALTVGEDAGVFSGDDDAVEVSNGADAFVWNAGIVNSNTFDAIDIRSVGPITIINSGRISGVSDGIVTESVGARTRIVNSGEIVGTEDGGIDHLGGDSLVINRGQISGGEFYGFQAGDGRDELRNSGSVESGVFLTQGDDTVINSGVIDRVDLGEGDDVYLGRREGSAGSVFGGEGEDRLTGSRANDIFAGGAGSDTFVFQRRGGVDRIFDFSGDDSIDLSALGLDGFAEVRGATRNVRNGCLIDFSDDLDLTLRLIDVSRGELRGPDFIFDALT